VRKTSTRKTVWDCYSLALTSVTRSCMPRPEKCYPSSRPVRPMTFGILLSRTMRSTSTA
jgi:hypothetical protein